jgi:hypothetical protein
MKHYIWIFLAILACNYFAYANCVSCAEQENNSHNSLSEKIYVPLERISFHDSKIFIQLFDKLLVVPAIYSDQLGYYVLSASCSQCRAYEWRCNVCGTCNSLASYMCSFCRSEMPD